MLLEAHCKKNTTNIDVLVPQGDYIRSWIPELQAIKGGAIHTPWALSSSMLMKCEVTLGHTYPMPVVKAPEWAKHIRTQVGVLHTIPKAVKFLLQQISARVVSCPQVTILCRYH